MAPKAWPRNGLGLGLALALATTSLAGREPAGTGAPGPETPARAERGWSEALAPTEEIIPPRDAASDAAWAERLEGLGGATPPLAPTQATETNRTLVILANFTDLQTSIPTAQEVQDLFDDLVSPWYLETSYGKLDVDADVVGWVQMSIPQECTPLDILDVMAAATAAADPYVPDFTIYDTFVLVAPWTSDCVNKAWAYRRPMPISTPDGVLLRGLAYFPARPITGYFSSFQHEIGHTLGLHHASFLDCGYKSLGTIGQGCSQTEYDHLYDLMGYWDDTGHFSGPKKHELGWLEAEQVTEVTASGTYTIEPLETATGGPKLLRIPRPGVGASDWQELFVEYRQPIGFDEHLPGNVFAGALIQVQKMIDFDPMTFLIDSTPYPASNESSILEVGQTFVDYPTPEHMITITPMAASASELTLEVTVGPAVPADPEILLLSPVEGETISYAATWNVEFVVLDPDTPSVEYCIDVTSAGGTVTPVGCGAVAHAVPTTVSWDTGGLLPGEYSLRLAVDDGAASVEEVVGVTILPNSPPYVALVDVPEPMQPNPGLITVTFWANDWDGEIMNWCLNVAPVGTEDWLPVDCSSGPSGLHTVTWNTNGFADGPYLAELAVSDSLDTTVQPMVFVLDSSLNFPPLLDVTAPVAGGSHPAGTVVIAFSIDDANDESLDWCVHAGPSGGTLTEVACATSVQAGSFNAYWLTGAFQGPADIRVSVTDGQDSTETVVTINVWINDPPTVELVDPPNGSDVPQGFVTVSFDIADPDAQDATLDYCASVYASSGQQVSSSCGEAQAGTLVLAGWDATQAPGLYTVVVLVTDSAGVTAADFAVIELVNVPPEAYFVLPVPGVPIPMNSFVAIGFSIWDTAGSTLEYCVTVTRLLNGAQYDLGCESLNMYGDWIQMGTIWNTTGQGTGNFEIAVEISDGTTSIEITRTVLVGPSGGGSGP